MLTKHLTTSIRLFMNTYVESVWCASGVDRYVYHFRYVRCRGGCGLLHLAPTLDTTAHSHTDYRLQAEHMTCWETRVRRVGSFMTASTGVVIEPITVLKRFTHTRINMAASCLQALLPSKLVGACVYREQGVYKPVKT